MNLFKILIIAGSLFFSTTSQVTQAATELACLSSAIYYESNTEPYAGKVAVALTIIERKNHKKYANSICTVISEYQQFPWFNRLDLPIKVFDETKKIAEDALAGKIKSVAPGATHFHSVKIKPTWSKDMTHITTIGNHRFYKEYGRTKRRN